MHSCGRFTKLFASFKRMGGLTIAEQREREGAGQLSVLWGSEYPRPEWPMIKLWNCALRYCEYKEHFWEHLKKHHYPISKCAISHNLTQTVSKPWHDSCMPASSHRICSIFYAFHRFPPGNRTEDSEREGGKEGIHGWMRHTVSIRYHIIYTRNRL